MILPALLLTTFAAVPLEPPTDPLPHLEWGRTVLCVSLGPTPAVPSGEFRAQCDEDRRVCLVSPTQELQDGVESGRRLERVQPCHINRADWEARADRGWRFVPAVAEAPPGWVRDASGRVMQFNFDLNRRIYLGGAWAPLWPYRDAAVQNRYRADFGIEIELPDDEGDTLHRLGFVEGEFFFAQNAGRLTGFRYDWNHASSRSVARVTTLLGRPARFDLTLNLGGYLSALRWDVVRRDGVDESELLLATAQPTFDLWHSADLVSWLRLRAGPAVVLDTEREDFGLMGQAALEADTTLDARGFHHARLIAEAERVWLLPEVEGRAGDPSRLRLIAEYEVIILAINDQPLSLVLDGRGAWRDDLPGVTPRWEWGAGAGLRFSLWAPARRNTEGAR